MTAAAGRAAVLVPGAAYTADGPLLMYARHAVERRGGRAHALTWSVPRFTGQDDQRAWVISQVTAAVEETAAATGTRSPAVIGKSLASLAAPVAADRGLAAIWFTPLLTDQPAVAALRRSGAPFLLVGGTADRLWNGTVARSLTSHVVEIDGADHGMFVPGDLAASAAVLGRVMTAVERFLDDVVWH